jgi:formamidopyrimidine-DNA glycosylase
VPELPDVEGFKRYYARHAAGRRVESIAVPAPGIVRNTSPQALGRALRGARLERPDRRGKWMLAPAGGHLVLFHFGMTGFLVWTSRPGDEERHRHDRLILALGGGELRYRNMRMLGGVWLARDRDDAERIIGPLGPDAAALSRQQLDEVLAPARGGIKGLLMNQRRVAGIGNELSDEILWRARLHPRRRAGSLDARERGRLRRALREVIATSNRHGRIPARGGRWLKSQRGGRKPRCPRCRARVGRATVVGRTAYWCPRCQPERG